MHKYTHTFKHVIAATLVAVACPFIYGGCGGVNMVTISGSSSVMPLMQQLAAEYEKQNDVRIVINMSSSGSGISDVKNGLSDFGMSSRQLNDSETGITSQLLCYDGIALIVGKNSQSENVTDSQVKNLFEQGIPITDQGITAGIGRDAASGTRIAFDELMNISVNYHTSIATLAETGNVIEAISPTTSSLGYISYGSMNSQIKALKFNGVECTADNIKNGSYQLQRPFIIVVKEDSQLSQHAQAFYDYIFSDNAQRIITEQHYISTK